MSKKTEKNPLRTIIVSERDRAIYEAVMVDNKQQRVVAIEFKLSQPRISAIIKRVTRWLAQGYPPGFSELYRRERLRAVARLHRMRLEKALVEVHTAWVNSGETGRTIHEKVVNGEVVSRDTKVQTRPLDPRYLREMNAIRDRIVAFEGFDKLGRVDESVQGRVFEEPERTPVDAYREVKRRMILGGFDTPGDEGIPGMWGKEMVQRNAEVGKGRSEKAEGRSEKAEGRSEGAAMTLESEATAWEGEAPAEPLAPRQQGEITREYAGINQEYSDNTPVINTTTPEILGNNPIIKSSEVLSENASDSAQVQEQPAITVSEEPRKVLSKCPPKVPRYRLMGTAAEMARSKGYDEFFSDGERIVRALERAEASAGATRAQGLPLTPTLSAVSCSEYREYRGEGVMRAQSPHHPHAPSPTLRTFLSPRLSSAASPTLSQSAPRSSTPEMI